MKINKKHSDFWVRVLKTFVQGAVGVFATLNISDVELDKALLLTVLGAGIAAVASMVSNIDFSRNESDR